jgi:hypothetical protein
MEIDFVRLGLIVLLVLMVLYLEARRMRRDDNDRLG